MQLHLRNSRCLVLGAGGFLGKNLCLALAEVGAIVTGFDRGPCPDIFNNRVKWKSGDFTSLQDYADDVAEADFVFHLIATTVPGTSNSDILYDIDSNLKTTVQLLEHCRKYRGKKIIFASSGGAVYGVPTTVPTPETGSTCPISSYGIMKIAIERYLSLFEHLYSLEYRILRIANPFGPFQNGQSHQGAIASFMYRILAGKVIDIWGNGEVVRDYLYVNDVVDALISVCAYDGKHRIFNIGSGEGRSLNQLLKDLSRVTGKQPDVRYHEARKTDVPSIVLDCSLAARELLWHAKTPFETSLNLTKNWMQTQI
jgi:UDP-glucose 4-epimerase